MKPLPRWLQMALLVVLLLRPLRQAWKGQL
jgi:hypothetical protein